MEIHFEIENRCLLGCNHCSSCATSNGCMKEYSIDNMVSFLNSLQGKKEVFLTGGEPLLYPEIDELLEQLNTEVKNIVLGMFTTGIRGTDILMAAVSESYARQLAHHGLKVCYISIYSHRKEEHDWMTNCEGSFDLTRLSIQHLQEAGVEIRFNTVITSRNENEMPQLIEMAKEWGVTEVRLLKLIRHGRAENCWDVIGITEDRYCQVVSAVLKRKNSIRITASGLVDIIPCRLSYNENACPAGKYLWYVTYKGDVFPCASIKNRSEYRIGSIKENIGEQCKQFCERSEGLFQSLCKSRCL